VNSDVCLTGVPAAYRIQSCIVRLEKVGKCSAAPHTFHAQLRVRALSFRRSDQAVTPRPLALPLESVGTLPKSIPLAVALALTVW
jgi:hypothetical protein